MNSAGKLVIGVDIGGTFTDVFVHNETSGSVRTAKVPSTPDDPARAFLSGIETVVDDLSTVSTIVHGTTVATNALLENKGAKTGLITTSGFRDVLEMRRRDRPTTWGLRGSYEPVVPRNLRLEVTERTLADGTVREDVDLNKVDLAVDHLLQQGCKACCLFFINGYANDANERAAAERIRARWPNAFVSVATEIVPEIREFERVSTAALNAILQPLVSAYLDNIHSSLRAKGFNGELLIVQSNGGVMSIEMARQLPVRTALSGPAAGVIAAREIAAAAGLPDIVTCDMGGTSFDVSLIEQGEGSLSAQTSIGFGRVIRTPMIEITTIGAGGGSIAHVDADGILKVGPHSAGSNPGPACYGLGNRQPTVTDANLLLGRINPGRPIGVNAGVNAGESGEVAGDRLASGSLDLEAARNAIDTCVAQPLGLEVMAAADAILRVANAHMAGAIRLVSIERGHDPTRFTAMPFGGGGALHTGALIKDVGLRATLVPRYPGITSAMGCVVADLRHDRVQTVNRMLDDCDAVQLAGAFTDVADELQERVLASGVSVEGIERFVELDMLYLGQTHAVSVPLNSFHNNQVGGNTGALTLAEIHQAFDDTYLKTYGRLLEGIAKRVLNYRVIVIGRRPSFNMNSLGLEAQAAVTGTDTPEPLAIRPVWVNGASVQVPVYNRESLGVGSVLKGPALVEQADTTIFVDPGLVGSTDSMGNLLIERDDF